MSNLTRWEPVREMMTLREAMDRLFRSILLPVDVQTDKAKADFENGILTVSLPKAEAVKPRSISIKAK